MTSAILATVVALATTAAVLLRPWRVHEAWWALGGAAACVAIRAVSPLQAWYAVWHGNAVYAFLAGILALSALAKREGLFDACAAALVQRAGPSQPRLFLLLFAGAAVLTAVLSNDTTIVVATPAVLAVLARTNVKPLPYLLICAFVANAASAILPISNPTNLLLFGSALPGAVAWLRSFALPSAAAIVSTYLVLRFVVRGWLQAPIVVHDVAARSYDARFRLAAGIVCGAAALLVAAAIARIDVGYAALGLAVMGVLLFGARYPDGVRGVAAPRGYAIVALVAGLFVIVAALDQTGVLHSARALTLSAAQGGFSGALLYGAGVAVACNLLNNLPVATALASTLPAVHLSALQRVATIGVDVGPNLSISGSLATLLWLQILRENGVRVGALQFSMYGAAVTLPSLLLAMAAAFLF